MTGTPTDTDTTWGPTLSPYLLVTDAPRALDWYGEVFGARRRGEVYVMPDGSVGHAELVIGDAVLMLAEGPGEAPSAPPRHAVHVRVPDVDDTVRRAAAGGASVEREPADQPYGRVAAIVDPFGHRWLLNQPTAPGTCLRHGDVAYVSMLVPDDEAARDFYGAVLGWRSSPGSVEHAWQVEEVAPRVGIARGEPAVQLCYRVTDVEAAAERVRRHSGSAGEVARRPYGLMIDCTDPAGAHFQLWQPG